MRSKKAHTNIIKIQFRNGETVLSDGFNEIENKIKRANLDYIFPLRALKENIIYFLLLILQVFSSQALYFVGILLIIQQWLVDFHNFIKIRKMDQMINTQEARVLKQWDECIINKEIIEKIKERLNKKDQSESNQRQKSKSQVEKNSQFQIQKAEQAQNQKKGTIISNVSIPFQNISYKYQQSAKNIKSENANKYNQMSPLIHKDMALKLKQIQLMENDPLIIEFKKKVPKLFQQDVTPTAQKIPLNEKLKKMESDKMNLIKLQNVENIMIGDVIILERNQRAPCDILVLHCNDENFSVQHQLCDYSSTTVRKPVVQNRSDSQNLAQFKKSLTGNIVFYEHNFNIKGFFQLKKDPQSRIFGFENFIFCQERLLATPWILGIAAKVGNSCQCYTRYIGQLRFENSQYLQHYIILLVIVIVIIQNKFKIQIIVFNQNEFLRNFRSITQIIIDNCIYLILMVPHFYKIYYKTCSIIQLKGIGTIDQKQIMSCHIDKYINKQFLTISVDAFIEQSFKLQCIIYDNKLCEVEEEKFIQFVIQTQAGLNIQSEVIQNERDEEEDNQYGSELLSQRDCRINQIPKSVQGRFIYFEQQESKEEFNQNYIPLVQPDQTSKDKTLIENHDGYNETFQRVSNPIRSSKGYQQSKEQFKQEDYLINEQELCQNMMRNNDPNELNPLLLQLAMNHLAFSKLLITEKKEQKVKNKFLGQLDQKQVNLAKEMGYEFICVNNVQNVQHYIIQIKQEFHSFKLVITKLDIQRQRLFMLFEMVDAYWDDDKEYILFLREANVKKNEGIDGKIWKHQYDQLHYIYYSYCYLTEESANVFLQSVESNTPDNQLYTLMEQVFKLNIILGLRYTLKSDCQDFMRNVRKSEYQMFVYTQNQEIFSTSILYQSDLLLQNDLVLHFNQQNEEDLRAYFKQSLQDFSNTFGQASINSSQFIKISALNSQKQITVDQVDEKPRTKKIILMMNNQTLQYIMENNYFKNNLKLILSFTKVLFLYQATQDQLNIVQDMWCTSDKTINILHENQSLLRCFLGCQIQLLQLQQFSKFQNQKTEKEEKKNFFSQLNKSLKQRLIFEKCYFNEMQVNSNTDVILQDYKQLDRILFFQSPLLKIFFRALYQQTMGKTITFVTSFTFVTTIYTWNTLDQMDYLLEIIFYFYLYQFFLFSLQHYSFVDKSKRLKNNKDQSILLQKYSQHRLSIKNTIIMITKHMVQGILISSIFIYRMNELEYYLYIFMSISISDWLYLMINLNIIEAIILAGLFPIIFYLYILFDSLQNNEWNKPIDLQDVFSIILGITFILTTNILLDYLENQHSISIPNFNEDFLSYLNYLSLIIAQKQKKKTLTTILQNRVNELFENIEQVDLSIQKLLLNQQNNQSKFGQWRQQIFKKAQTILMWKKKQIIQSFQLLFYHSTFIIIMYFYQDRNDFFLIDYLVNFCLQAVYFAIHLVIKLPTNQQEYLEYAKFILSTAANISILFVIKSIENISSVLTIEFFIAYELSIKFHPIYDFRIYVTTTVATMIGYISWYVIENDSIISNQVAIIQFIILFSVLQYFVKSYFIQLEEDQAQNKLNFIEQNNKINDILGILLPKFIRDRLNETDQYNIHQNQGLVAIVFCDICNFDQMVIEEKDKIITFLDDIFRTFDKYCQIYGVQKIETVGKTYLASAGLKACEQELTYLSQVDPVQRALNLAEQMMIYIRSKMWGYKGQQLVGKIGIHYGGAISGVIGFHKPQFSLIGDTVNTTSRVCSTGLEDAITLSEQAFDQLKNENIEFEIRNVEMKGLGVRPTYIYKFKIQKKDNPLLMEVEQDVQSKDGRSQCVVRKNPEIFKKDLKKRKTVLTQIDTMKQKTDQMQEQGAPNVFGIKTRDPTYHQPHEEKSRNSIQVLSKGDEKNRKQSQAKPSTFKRLVTIFQNKFQLENYEPEIDEQIDYEQLLNVILLKNEYTLEHNIIKETSFMQLLQISYYKKQMNQFVSYEEYQEFVKIQSKNQTVQNLRIYVLYYTIKSFCQIQFYENLNLGFIVLQWLCCLVNLIQFLVNSRQFFEKWKKFIQILLSFEALLSGLIIILDENDLLKNIHVYEIIFIQSLFCSIQILSFWIKVLFSIAIAFYSTIILAIDGTQIISIYFVIICSMYNIMLILLIEQQQVGCFNQKIIFKTQQQKESQLLQYLLPKHILNKFLDDRIGNIGICDKIDDLTILFADIAGFTEYSSKVKPEEVLVMLKNLFVEFDRKCCDLNVYKLYTIGDCYVAIGMIDYNNRNPHQEAKNIVELAFEMINIIAQVRKQINFDGLNMRIGVHTGSVFGGVMGTDIVRYDVYGPDVLIANKMESNGVKGYVQVSQQTKKLLEEDFPNLFNFNLNVTLELKSIGRQIEGYLVKKQEDNDINQQDHSF